MFKVNIHEQLPMDAPNECLSNKQMIILKQPSRYVLRNSYPENFGKSLQKYPRRSVTIVKLQDLIKRVNLQKLLTIADVFLELSETFQKSDFVQHI